MNIHLIIHGYCNVKEVFGLENWHTVLSLTLLWPWYYWPLLHGKFQDYQKKTNCFHTLLSNCDLFFIIRTDFIMIYPSDYSTKLGNITDILMKTDSDGHWDLVCKIIATHLFILSWRSLKLPMLTKYLVHKLSFLFCQAGRHFHYDVFMKRTN